MRRALVVAWALAALADLVSPVGFDGHYSLVTAIIIGAATVAAAGISAGASAYSSNQQAKGAQKGLDAMMSQAGLLGPAGLYMGSDNLALLKENMNKILSEEGFFYGDSPEYAQRNIFAAGLKPDEKQLIGMGVEAAHDPGVIAGEQEGIDFLRQLVSGQYLPGQAQQNPQLNAILNQIQKRTGEEIDLGTRAFESSAAGALGGLSGAGSALPEVNRLQRDITAAGAEAEQRTLFDMWNQGQAQRLQGVPLFGQASRMPFERLLLGQHFAKIPREIADLRIQRSLGAFDNRVNRFINANLGAAGQITGNLAPAYGAAAAGTVPDYGPAIQALGQGIGNLGALYAQGGLGGAPAGTAPAATTAAPTTGFGQVQIPQGYFSGGGAGADYGGNAFMYPTRDSYSVATNSVFNPYQTSVYSGFNPNEPYRRGYP